jgi:hypothetical protein
MSSPYAIGDTVRVDGVTYRVRDVYTTNLADPLISLADTSNPNQGTALSASVLDRVAEIPTIDVPEHLQDGGTVVLSYDPGQTGATNEHGDLTHEPYDPFYIAEARDADGNTIGSGAGMTVATALQRITPDRRAALGVALSDNEPPF